MICSHCGKELGEAKKFCPYCGGAVMAAAAQPVSPEIRPTAPNPEAPVEVAPAGPQGPVCPGCGAPIRPGKKFCPSCGRPISPEEARPAPPPKAPREPKTADPAAQKRLLLVLVVVLAAALVLVLVVGGVYLVKRGQEKAPAGPVSSASSEAVSSAAPSAPVESAPSASSSPSREEKPKYRVATEISGEYRSADNFQENGLARVRMKDNKWYLIDTNQNVFAGGFDELGYFSEGICQAEKNGKHLLLDENGDTLLIPEGSAIRDMSEGVAGVFLEGGGVVYVNNEGTEKLRTPPHKYDRYGSFHAGRCKVLKNNRCGFIDMSGKLVIPMIYTDSGVFDPESGLAPVKENGKWGYIDTQGNMVIPATFDKAEDFKDGIALVSLNGKMAHLRPDESTVNPFVYDQVWRFSNDLATVRIDNRYGYINQKGEEVIPVELVDVLSFSSELLPAKRLGDELWGYLDKTGKPVLDNEWDYAGKFNNGIAKVSQNGSFGYIDTAGRMVVRLDYKEGGILSGGMLPLQRRDGLWGYVKIDKDTE